MENSSDQNLESDAKVIRRLRKKLRQIERLEKSRGELTHEEKVKLSCKHDIRSKLQTMLSSSDEADISLESQSSEFGRQEEDCNIYEEKDAENLERGSQDKKLINDIKQEILLPSDEKGTGDDESKQTSSPTKSFESTVPSSKKEKGQKVENTRSALRRFWRNSSFQVQELKGHNEAINCIDTTDFWIISGSRDTTLKLWDVATGEELKNMGCHNGQVTTVKILTEAASDFLRKNIEPSTIQMFSDIEKRCGGNERIAISGSTDCSIRVWLLPIGLFVKSIYNYNPISAMAYYDDLHFVIVGSSSGNLTVYNLCSDVQVYSATIHSYAITEIKTLDNQVITSSVNGSLKVWNIQRNADGQTKPKKQKLKTLEFNVASDEFDISIQHSFEEHDKYVPERHIQAFCTYKGNIIFGDDGSNIKIWNPMTGELTKMRNHNQNVPGITDGVAVVDQLLVSSSYNMDNGVGSVNVRSLQLDCYSSYIASFSDPSIPRLSKFSVQFGQEQKFLVTGGDKLLLWKFVKHGGNRTDDGITVRGQNIAGIASPPADSDVESDEETSADDDEGSFWPFWSKPKPKPSESLQDRDTDDDGDYDGSDCKAEEFLNTDYPQKKSGFSICDWCSIV